MVERASCLLPIDQSSSSVFPVCPQSSCVNWISAHQFINDAAELPQISSKAKELFIGRLLGTVREQILLSVLNANQLKETSFSLSHSVGLLRAALKAQFALVGDLHSFWTGFGEVLLLLYRCETICDSEIVLVYEILSLWKAALPFYLQRGRNDEFFNEQHPFKVLSDTHRHCLTECFQDLFNPCTSQDNSNSDFHQSQFLLCHLLLRSYRMLLKLVHNHSWLSPLKSSLLRTWLEFIKPVEHLPKATVLNSFLSQLALAEATSGEKNCQAGLCEVDHSVCVRLVVLLNLDILAYVDSIDLTFGLLRSLRSFVWAAKHGNSNSEPSGYEKLLVNLLADDDAHLFEGLDILLLVEGRWKHLMLQHPEWQYVLPRAHWIFAHLARSIDYAVHLFVDWIVSPETCCLTYIVHYLRLFRTLDSQALETRNTACLTRLPFIASVCGDSARWPRESITQLLEEISVCLEKLNNQGNVPFNPSPLIRSLDFAITILKVP